VKLVHLVGFVIQKFVAMHGRMNVKKITNLSTVLILRFFLTQLTCTKFVPNVNSSQK